AIQLVSDTFAERGAPLDGDPGEQRRVYDALPPLPRELAARLETLMERYASHDLLRTWYIRESSFIQYWYLLLLRIACLRFVISAEARLTPGMDEAAFDALAVRIVYNVARTFEHSENFIGNLRGELTRLGMELAQAISLIQL